MAQLAIKGHKTRGKEVIKILEMLGYVNYHKYSANTDSLCLYGGENTSTIYYDWVNNCEDMHVFALEEFLEKYPYKVGDKVQHKGATSCGTVYEVEKMRWVDNEIEYTIKRLWYWNGHYTVTAQDLQIYKEETMDKAVFGANAQCCDIMNHLIKKETMEEKIESFEILESHCANEVKIEFDPSKFEIVKRDNGYYVVKKLPQYPKTYVECAKILECFSAYNIDGYKNELLEKLQELLICRDAYWKIAGEQMRLDKPLVQCVTKWKYGIRRAGDTIITSYSVSCVLVFPTAEMRDAFYENFKDLIESCKELL